MRRITALALFLLVPAFSQAWDYPGHRTVNALALAALPSDFPAFALTADARERVTFLAGEPDRWRNETELPLRHVNAPDHYIDLEGLDWAGLTLESVPDLRYQFTIALADARREHPDRFPAIDPTKDQDHTREEIGFLPWAITENYEKLRSAFAYLREYEQAGTPEEIANAQQNVLYVMGVLGHYVGDGAQPLHNTVQTNGWVGPNPKGFTTSKGFHAWIDGGFFQKTGGIAPGPLLDRVKPAPLLDTRAQPGQRDPVFVATLAYLKTHYGRVEELYQLDKDGKLSPANPAAGRAFLEQQILDGAEMLGSLWYTAWHDAPADRFLHAQLQERKLHRPDKP